MKNLETIRDRLGAAGLLEVLAEDAKTLEAASRNYANTYENCDGSDDEIQLEALNKALAMIDRDELLLGKLVEIQHRSDAQLLIDRSVTEWAARIRAERE